MRRIGLGLFAVTFAVLSYSPAVGGQILTNGDFETGDFTGWTLADAGNGMSEVTGANAPSNGVFPTVGASEGSFYAVTSQGSPGTHAMIQAFSIDGPVASAILTFDMFAQTRAGVSIIDPAGLDHTVLSNQHARVDILTAGATPFDTGSGVLQNFYIGSDGAPTQPYTSYSFDVTSLLSGGGMFQLRFAETDNQGNFNLGVDAVSLVTSKVDVVPEPGTLAIFGFGALGLVGMGMRNKRKPPAQLTS